jgi:TRAP-type C4-dicarboxylate transport system substrate-binding protein
MQRAVSESVTLQRDLHVKEEEDAQRTIECEGCEIVELNAEQHNAFAAAVQPIKDEAARLYGDDLFKLL